MSTDKQIANPPDAWKCCCGCNNRPNQVDCYSCGKPRTERAWHDPDCRCEFCKSKPAVEPGSVYDRQNAAGWSGWTCACGHVETTRKSFCGACWRDRPPPTTEPADSGRIDTRTPAQVYEQGFKDGKAAAEASERSEKG